MIRKDHARAVETGSTRASRASATLLGLALALALSGALPAAALGQEPAPTELWQEFPLAPPDDPTIPPEEEPQAKSDAPSSPVVGATVEPEPAPPSAPQADRRDETGSTGSSGFAWSTATFAAALGLALLAAALAAISLRSMLATPAGLQARLRHLGSRSLFGRKARAAPGADRDPTFAEALAARMREVAEGGRIGKLVDGRSPDVQLELCAIGWHPGRLKSYFSAASVGADGDEHEVARSASFRSSGDLPDRGKRAAAAHSALVERLVREGWEVAHPHELWYGWSSLGRSEVWFGERFRRVAIASLQASGPEPDPEREAVER